MCYNKQANLQDTPFRSDIRKQKVSVFIRSCASRRTSNLFDAGRGVEQLAARKAHNLEVGGSSPLSATKIFDLKAQALSWSQGSSVGRAWDS